MQPMPRGSSATPSMSKANDPRNISDKQFMNSSIRVLIDYLATNNFEHAINPKILTRPAVKDFQNIVMFLFKQIDPNYNPTGKFEDEVVMMFKFLGYPYQISKANIAAVGSIHAWPSLLASIMWLVELLTYDEVVVLEAQNQEADDADVDFDDQAALERAFQLYIGTSYALFMIGDDDRYADCEAAFVNSYESVNTAIQNEITDYEERNSSLNQDIIEVEKRRDYLPQLEIKQKEYEKDKIKFEQLINQLEKHKEQIELKVIERKDELLKLKLALNNASNDVEELKTRIASQDLSPEDVKRLLAERDQLQLAQEQASDARQVQWVV